jgi:glycosyltransferase involved in cell wall biosynthesis
VVLEAMASGLPVITSRRAGVAEIIEHGVDGLLLEDPTDAKQMAQTIDELLKNAEKAASMGVLARAKACRYDWHSIAVETELIYQTVLLQSRVEKTNL